MTVERFGTETCARKNHAIGLKMIGCLKAEYKLQAAIFRVWNHCNANDPSFSEIWDLLLMTALFFLFVRLFFLLEVLILDLSELEESSSRTLLSPFTIWELPELESSGKNLLPKGFSLTKPHDNSCMDGSKENKRNI